MTTPQFYLITGDKCVWCDRAKALIESKGGRFIAYSYSEHEMLLPLMTQANLRSVPQIWVQGGAYIGGYECLVEYFKSQEVKE